LDARDLGAVLPRRQRQLGAAPARCVQREARLPRRAAPRQARDHARAGADELSALGTLALARDRQDGSALLDADNRPSSHGFASPMRRRISSRTRRVLPPSWKACILLVSATAFRLRRSRSSSCPRNRAISGRSSPHVAATSSPAISAYEP